MQGIISICCSSPDIWTSFSRYCHHRLAQLFFSKNLAWLHPLAFAVWKWIVLNIDTARVNNIELMEIDLDARYFEIELNVFTDKNNRLADSWPVISITRCNFVQITNDSTIFEFVLAWNGTLSK